MIRLIIFIIVLIAVLSYFNISIRSFIESDMFQDNLGYVSDWCGYLWNNYLAGPARYLWYDIFLDILWDSFVDNMDRIKDGGSPGIIDLAPSLPSVKDLSD